MFSTSGGGGGGGGYHVYIGRYHDACADIMSTSGDIMMHVKEQVGKSLLISIENPDVLNTPLPSPDVLMISP